MKENPVMNIHSIDNTVMSSEFSEELCDAVTVVSKIKKFFKREYFVIQSEGSSIFFLLRNIKSIKISPTSRTPEGNVLSGAKAHGQS